MKSTVLQSKKSLGKGRDSYFMHKQSQFFFKKRKRQNDSFHSVALILLPKEAYNHAWCINT